MTSHPLRFRLKGHLDEAADVVELIAFGTRQTVESVRRQIQQGELIIEDIRRLPRERGTCGAHARTTGKPCRAPGNGAGGRCKLHGGRSTGPKTPEGLARLEAAVRKRWDRWRQEREAIERV